MDSKPILRLSMLFPAYAEAIMASDSASHAQLEILDAVVAGHQVKQEELIDLLLDLHQVKPQITQKERADALCRVSRLVCSFRDLTTPAGTSWDVFDEQGSHEQVVRLRSVVGGLAGDPFIAVNDDQLGWVTYPDLIKISNGRGQYLVVEQSRL